MSRHDLLVIKGFKLGTVEQSCALLLGEKYASLEFPCMK